MNRLRIGFLCEFDPSDRRASSGTSHSVWNALREIGDPVWLPISRRVFPGKVLAFLRRALRRVAGVDFDYIHTSFGSRLACHPVDPASLRGFDVIVGFFCLHNIHSLHSPVPMVYISDATLAGLVGYYPGFRMMSPRNVRAALDMDRRMLSHVDLAVYGSDWARQSALDAYGADPVKVAAIPYGPNFSEAESAALRPRVRRLLQGETLEMLFIGVDWERKGGDVALETLRRLNASGVRARLHVVGPGMLPDGCRADASVVFHGFLDKNNPEDAGSLQELYGMCHCLLLPTRAECAGIVFSEAAAWGLPVYTFATGGTGSYVADGVSGRRLPPGATGSDFARVIAEDVVPASSGAESALQKFSSGALRLSAERLNWKAWASRLRSLILPLLPAVDQNQ